MIIPFGELCRHEFSLSDIHVICQRPAYRQLNMSRRSSNGFMYLAKGECTYHFGGRVIHVFAGALVYLPLASEYIFKIISDEIEFYRINFTLRVRGEIVLFSAVPTVLAQKVPEEGEKAIQTLEETCRFDNNSILKIEKLCSVFSSLPRNTVVPYAAKLVPAVTYLQQHLAGPLNCHELAAMCFLSTAQFYNLFHANFGMTPLNYRNKLLLDRAIMLLKSGDIRVNEIADMLGFTDPAYFSRFFKKHTGCSPTQYVRLPHKRQERYPAENQP